MSITVPGCHGDAHVTIGPFPKTCVCGAVRIESSWSVDLVGAAGAPENVPAYLGMEAEQREQDFADDCGYPFAAHIHPTVSGEGKTWACPAAEVRALKPRVGRIEALLRDALEYGDWTNAPLLRAQIEEALR